MLRCGYWCPLFLYAADLFSCRRRHAHGERVRRGQLVHQHFLRAVAGLDRLDGIQPHRQGAGLARQFHALAAGVMDKPIGVRTHGVDVRLYHRCTGCQFATAADLDRCRGMRERIENIQRVAFKCVSFGICIPRIDLVPVGSPIGGKGFVAPGRQRR